MLHLYDFGQDKKAIIERKTILEFKYKKVNLPLLQNVVKVFMQDKIMTNLLRH